MLRNFPPKGVPVRTQSCHDGGAETIGSDCRNNQFMKRAIGSISIRLRGPTRFGLQLAQRKSDRSRRNLLIEIIIEIEIVSNGIR